MLTLVQGDVFETCIKIRHVDPDLITQVLFECKDLGLCIIGEKTCDEYSIRLEGSFTKGLKCGIYRYCLTLTLLDGEKLTVDPNGAIQVLKKRGTT